MSGSDRAGVAQGGAAEGQSPWALSREQEERIADVRAAGLGPLWHNVDDRLVYYVLHLLDPHALAALCVVSKLWYVYASDERLWKSITLSTHKGMTAFPWCSSWKRTWARAQRGVDAPEDAEAGAEVRVQGFYSAYLYRKWYRSHVDMSHFDVDMGHVERRAGLSVERFAAEYGCTGKPVLLTDVMAQWAAMRQWTPSALVHTFGDRPIRTSNTEWCERAQKAKRVWVSLGDFVRYATHNADVDPLYVFDSKAFVRWPSLTAAYTVPKYFREDFFAVLGKNRPDHKWFLMGGPRSGSPFHFDPQSTSAWNALVCGSKRWALYPPGCVPPGVRFWQTPDDDHWESPKPLRWFLEVYPYLSPEQKPLEVVQRAGEVIWVPSGWWHMVLNLDLTVCVTHNHCNTWNFPSVWFDLRRGRTPDEIGMHTTFERRLGACRPELFDAWPQWLEDHDLVDPIAATTFDGPHAHFPDIDSGEDDDEEEEEEEHNDDIAEVVVASAHEDE